MLWLVIMPVFVLIGLPAAILTGFVLARSTERRGVRRQPNFAEGTPGTRFEDFGRGTPAVLHGRERIVH